MTRSIGRAGVRCGLEAAGTVTALVAAALASGAAASATTAAPGGTAAASGIISTVAGGVGGPAKGTTVGLPGACGVASAGGHLYAGDNYSLRQVSGTGQLTTIAGTGVPAGPLGDGGPAVRATFNGVCAVTADRSGNLVVADALHDRIRVLATARGTFYGQKMTVGHVYTVAGDGGYGLGGDGGPATAATLDKPSAVAVDGAGNLVIADSRNWRIRVVAEQTGTFYAQHMTAGDIYTVAGGGSSNKERHPGHHRPAPDRRWRGGGQLGQPGDRDTAHNQIRVVAASTGTFYGRQMTAGDIYTVAGTGASGDSGDGGPAIDAEFLTAYGVSVDPSGNLLITDKYSDKIRVIAVRTGTFYGQAMTAGDIYTVAGNGTFGYSGDGGPATSAVLGLPTAVALDGAGNLVIADSLNHRIPVVAESTATFYGQQMTAGDIYTVAGNGSNAYSGDGGPATSAELNNARGLAASANGGIAIADAQNNRVRMVAGSTGTFYGRAMTAGHIYTVAGDGVGGFSGDGSLATKAKINFPESVALAGPGNIAIADLENNRIRMVAERTGTFFGRSMTAGHIYTVAGNGALGYAGDGGPATNAQLSEPWGVAVDAAGNLVIADTDNSRVRVVAARTGTFYGQQMAADDIYTVAGNGDFGFSGDGGPATSAELDSPTGVAVDGTGNLVLADDGNYRIRVVADSTGTFYGRTMTAGHIYTVAGNGTSGYAGDGGPAISAEFNGPISVAVDSAGNLAIADLHNSRIRLVAAGTGMFYGQAMTAGDSYTVAGNGHMGLSRDGDPAASAEINDPFGVAAGAAGGLLIGDTGNNRVRSVTG